MGKFQKCPPPRVHEVLIKKASDKLGIPCIPNRLAVITQATNGRPRVPLLRRMRTRLHQRVELLFGAGAGIPGDENRSREADHQRHGSGADHRREGKVTAVSYIDKTTRTEHQVRCRSVVLAASCCESTRLLLNSKGPRHIPTAWGIRRAQWGNI